MSTAAIVTEARTPRVTCASCRGTGQFWVYRPDGTDATPACVLHVGMWQRRLADVDAEAVTR